LKIDNSVIIMSILYRQANARLLRSEVNTPSNLREAGATDLPPLNVSLGASAARWIFGRTYCYCGITAI
jgi:hypothetical protein